MNNSIIENGNRRQAPEPVTSVEELATSYNFKRTGNEWHGANPTGSGATKDGYILNDDGSSYDRSLNQRFTSIETAKNFGIDPDEYEPVRWHRERNGHQNGTAPRLNRETRNIKPLANVIKNGNGSKPAPVKVTTYDYIKDGVLLFQAVRNEYSDGSKSFTQRRPDGAGGWVYNLKGIDTVLYHADDLKAAQTVLVSEGEKAADEINEALESKGLRGEFLATTNPMGADKWRDVYSEELAGKHVIILPDNDAPGRRHAAKIRESLTGKAASIKIVELPDLPEKGDVCEYFENGNTLADLLAVIDATPEYIAPKARFALISILELLQRPDPTWLVHGVLQSNTNSCLSATQRSLKSFLALDMALCIATGRQWCGRDVIQGNVIYVCAEGASGMKARVLAWCHDKGIDPKSIDPQYSQNGAIYFIDDAIHAHEPKDREDLQKALGEIKPVLIILDTLSLCALGLEENAAKDMNQFMDGVKKIQDATGAHVLLIHHHAKTGGARGSTAIPAAVQSEFELKRERDSATLTCLKQKDGPEFKPMTFNARSVEYDTWRRKSSLVLDYEGDSENTDSLTGSEQAVYEILVEYFGVAGASSSAWWAVAEEKKIIKGTFYRAQKNLVEKGRVDDGKNGQGGRGAIYRPVELLESESESSEKSQSLIRSHCDSETEVKPESLIVSSSRRDETNETETCELKKPARKSRKKSSEVTE